MINSASEVCSPFNSTGITPGYFATNPAAYHLGSHLTSQSNATATQVSGHNYLTRPLTVVPLRGQFGGVVHFLEDNFYPDAV